MLTLWEYSIQDQLIQSRQPILIKKTGKGCQHMVPSVPKCWPGSRLALIQLESCPQLARHHGLETIAIDYHRPCHPSEKTRAEVVGKQQALRIF